MECNIIVKLSSDSALGNRISNKKKNCCLKIALGLSLPQYDQNISCQ